MCKNLLQNNLTRKKKRHESNSLVMKWTTAFDFVWILLINNLRLAKFGSYLEVRLLANSISTFALDRHLFWRSLAFSQIRSWINTFSWAWSSTKTICCTCSFCSTLFLVGSFSKGSTSLSSCNSLTILDLMIGPGMEIPTHWSLFLVFPLHQSLHNYLQNNNDIDYIDWFSNKLYMYLRK